MIFRDDAAFSLCIFDNGFGVLLIGRTVRIVGMIQRLQLVAELQFSVQAAQLFSIRVQQLQVIIAQADIQIADNAGQLVIQRNAVCMR